MYKEALAGGERALGRRIGSLASGYRADIVVLNQAHPDLAAMTDDRWIDAYIFVAGKKAVDRVFVGGDNLVERGRHRARERIQVRYISVLRRLARS